MKCSKIFHLSIVFLLSSTFLVACGSSSSYQGDILETTASAEVLPTFLNNQQEAVRQIYAAVGKSTELLQWIPCYCGCGESAGHKSNRDCFIRAVNPDGSVVWNSHGAGCGVCLEIAAQSIGLWRDGKRAKDIRAFIEEKYKEGYALPTPTPQPS
ncbi:PCYCGC motif-containing (lipo)protein [Kyrpidia spormannii]|uniref:Uncharacterized protein n=1 Tax=Kyrpidia spormannii TaxID=2055160 RepID=A0ACA8Z7G4_9BACL|nr:PCYCGC motif-containing (lipo)protein [Kyrpidia spormannii]CAB3390905.1 conserved exported protein of unknown function [Kyrpidia spormannii]